MQSIRQTDKFSGGLLESRAFSGPDPMFGGVASHLSRVLGASPLVVRVAFFLMALTAGWGIVLYALIWLVTLGTPLPEQSPTTVRHNLGVIAATVSQMVLVIQVVDELPSELLWPACAVSFAVAVSEPIEPTTESRFWQTDLWRVGAGIVLMVGGLLAALGVTNDFAALWRAGIASVILVGGVILVAAPWLRGVLAASDAERRSRIRAEERSEMASHLHDSVLQTLTLIQNRAGESDIAAALAHQQERELRKWLYGQTDEPTSDDPGFRDKLETAAAEVEGQYLKIIECIIVGDQPMTGELQALVGAAREAMINAAKFAEIPMISVFAEITQNSALIFVRDRGVGFEPAKVPSDRHGISDSILNRVARVGGTVEVKSAPGQGTEVRIDWSR